MREKDFPHIVDYAFVYTQRARRVSGGCDGDGASDGRAEDDVDGGGGGGS